MEKVMRIESKIMFPMLLLTVLLSGCQKNDPVPLEEVQTPDFDTVNLTVWGAAEDEELLRQIIDKFEEAYSGQADFAITYHTDRKSVV